MEQNKKPLITVIVPIFNIKDCLERCVDSICAQTYKNLEILLIDDGSTDGTEKLCDILSERDDRIRVFHKENGGSSSARNLGLTKATGDYIGFVDSDDYIDPEMYEEMLALLEKEHLDVVQISRDEIDENGNKRPDVCIPPKNIRLCDNKTFLQELLLHEGDCSFCTKLFKRSLLEEKRFPIGELNEDFKLFVSMLPEISAVGILPKQGYHVFYRIGSNTRKKDKNDFSTVYIDIVRNADWVSEIVEKEFPELTHYAMRFGLFQRLDYMLHIPIQRMDKADAFYCQVTSYLRKHIRDTVRNPYLTGKNKVYLLLLSIAPKTVRKIHEKSMKLRGIAP